MKWVKSMSGIASALPYSMYSHCLYTIYILLSYFYFLEPIVESLLAYSVYDFPCYLFIVWV